MKENSGFITSGSSKDTPHPVPIAGRIRQKAGSRGVWVRRSQRKIRSFSGKRSNHGVMTRWSILLGVMTLLVIILVFSLWATGKRDVHSDLKSASYAYSDKVHVIDPLTQDEASQLVKSALHSKTASEVSTRFRLGNTSPEKALAFLREAAPDTLQIDNIIWFGTDSGARDYRETGLVSFEKGSIKQARLAIAIPDEKEGWRIDFNAFARTTKPSWEEILANPAQGGLVRVVISPDTYYNGPFPENDWSCFVMTSPDLQQGLYGYCRRNSPREHAIHNLIQSQVSASTKPVNNFRATLEIKQPEGARPTQFEITRVVAHDWALADEIYEDAFVDN